MKVFAGKTAVIVSASTEQDGGLHSEISLQLVLHRLGILLVATTMSLGRAQHAFSDDSQPRSLTTKALARDCGEALIRTTRLLNAEAPTALAVGAL